MPLFPCSLSPTSFYLWEAHCIVTAWKATLALIYSWLNSIQRLKLSKVDANRRLQRQSIVKYVIWWLIPLYWVKLSCSVMFMSVTSKPYVINWASLGQIWPQLLNGSRIIRAAWGVVHENFPTSRKWFPHNSQRCERAIILYIPANRQVYGPSPCPMAPPPCRTGNVGPFHLSKNMI